MRKQEGHQAWIVGIVEQGQRDAKVIDRPRIIEVITGDDGSVQVKIIRMRVIHFDTLEIESGSKNSNRCKIMKNTGSRY